MLFQVVIMVITSELVGQLSEYYILADPTTEETCNAYLFGAGLSILAFLATLLNLLFYIGDKIGGIVRILLTSTIYQKVNY